jgi:hypothetical protein
MKQQFWIANDKFQLQPPAVQMLATPRAVMVLEALHGCDLHGCETTLPLTCRFICTKTK